MATLVPQLCKELYAGNSLTQKKLAGMALTDPLARPRIASSAKAKTKPHVQSIYKPAQVTRAMPLQKTHTSQTNCSVPVPFEKVLWGGGFRTGGWESSVVGSKSRCTYVDGLAAQCLLALRELKPLCNDIHILGEVDDIFRGRTGGHHVHPPC